MKKIATIISLLVFTSIYSQEAQIKQVLTDVKRDSSDKTCQILFNNYYDSFESDSGLENPKMMTATLNLYSYKDDGKLPNKQLAVLLYQYITYVSEPDTALKWIQALKAEYSKVYGYVHPLILLYEGESLINAGRTSEAYSHFRKFQEAYPESIMAMVYIYQTEPDKNLAQTWLSILKKLHPNHWVVRKLPELH